uniref:Lp29 family lipoprotein n=1 Tax=Leptospira kmetyi TaxID=408139 RepID=UPI001FEEF43F
LRLVVFASISIAFFLHSCTSMNLVDSDPPMKQRVASMKKVALVGFHPYSTETIGVKLDGWIDTPCKSEISQKYGTDLKSAFFKGRRNVPSDHRAAYPLRTQVVGPLSWGDSISKFPAAGADESVSEENIFRFMEFSYSLVGAGALPDLCAVLSWDAGSKTFKMQKRNVDFYAVGFFTPVFSRPTVLGAITFGVTLPLSIFSIGILPTMQQRRTESVFRIYDSKLELVKEVKAENSFWSLDAIWAMPSDRRKLTEGYSYDAPAWEKDVEELDRSWKPE